MNPSPLAPVGVAEVVTALAIAEKTVPGAIHMIKGWIDGGPRPEPLPPLPDLVVNHLEVEAAHARARAAEAAKVSP